MASGVITIGGQKYAAGLYWQPSPDNKKVAKAARAAAAQPGYQAEFFCVREATKARSIAQFGLGLEEVGHKAGMPVAAACLANQQPGSWAGAFRVPEGIWFIVVRDDLIDPDGDAFFEDEEEAQSRLEAEIARGGLIKIYTPPEWQIDAADTTALSSLLSGRKDIVLQRVDAFRRSVLALLLIGIVLAAGIGGYVWYEMEQARIAAEEAARQAALEQQRRAMQQQIQYRREWESAPIPVNWLKACDNAFQKINLVSLSWRITGVECNGTLVSIQWTREAGKPAVAPENAAVDASLSSATSSMPLEPLQPRGPEALVPRDLINRLAMVNQWNVNWQDLPDEVIIPPEGQPPPPPPPWRKRKVVFTLNTSPVAQLDKFQELPGLVLTSSKLNGKIWTVEGTFYEKRTAP